MSNKQRPFSLNAIIIALCLVGLLVITRLGAQAAPSSLGWVGNMFPTGGSSNSINAGNAFNVYVQVYKGGVTEPGGQGANITCTLYWGQVSSFGGTWSNVTSTAMTYNADIGNNDEYKGTITPGAGLYEFTAYCTDTSDSTSLWRTGTNGMLTVNATSTTPTATRALWVAADTIAWNTAAASYELHYDAGGSLAVPNTAGSGLALTFSGTLTGSSYDQFPNINGYRALTLPSSPPVPVKTMLKGETAVAAYNASGQLIDATYLQIQGVLDDLYAANAASVLLGVTYSSSVPTVRLWAPTAQSVTLRRYASSTTTSFTSHPLAENSSTGVWSIVGDSSWDRDYYLFEIAVYVPETGTMETNLVTDPYAVSLSMNSQRSQFVDLVNDTSLEPANWPPSKPTLNSFLDISIYEVHVRDFSINDSSVPASDRGTFKAFSHTSANGMQHLLDLQAAGLTHIHLLPAFDIASVNEDVSARTEPSISFNPATDRDSEAPQAAVTAVAADDGFNWGYDPYHYGVPEGSYATNPDGPQRILEFRQMVQTLNANGLRVVMDVVYNHTSASGQAATSVLDKVVPGYYHRYNNNGNLQTSSCCADTASEFAMMAKLMTDTLVRWATAYQVDGFRFDLMNLHTVENANNIKTAVQSLTPGSDGVDGSKIYLYGEGWDFGSAKDKGLTHANQQNLAGTGIGTFNDRIRDATHGGLSTDPLQIRHQGFINGLYYDWNGYSYNNRNQSDLHYETDRLRVGLAGELAGYGNGTGYTTSPVEAINYISKHDNETLYDLNIFRLPYGTSMANRVRAQNMGLSLIGLSQGIPFLDLGSDMLRSKSLDRNSYNSGDWFNQVDFTYQDNNFGKGVPQAADNQTRWAIMKPLLADSSLSPAQANILASVAHLKEILQIRRSSPLFRLPSAAEITSRLTFYNSNNVPDGLIVMGISDAVGADLDPNYSQIFVLFNATPTAKSFAIPALVGNTAVSLHPVQQTSSDPVVQTSSFASGTGTFTVPGRTTAVFVDTGSSQPPSGLTLDGLLDTDYGSADTTDPGGDLANPGPANWSGTTWSDLTSLYCIGTNDYFYVYAPLPQYSQSVSSGQIGLLLDVNGSSSGGSGDPWGNAITFAHGSKPDYVVRGNIPGISGQTDGNNGWTELRSWGGSAWSAGGTNWGGIAGGGQLGSKIAYANGQGVELRIPLADIGALPGDSLNIQFFTTQSGATKGAYDSIPTDDQSTGWDDATTLDSYVACALPISGNTVQLADVADDVDSSGSFPVSLINADAVAAGDIYFTYDSTIGLDVSGATTTSRTAGFSVSYSEDNGIATAVVGHIHFSGGTIAVGSGAIFNVNYTVTAGATAGATVALDLTASTDLRDSSSASLALALDDGSFAINLPSLTAKVFVHLFEWKWTDIAKECTYLAEKGYHAVQVSPPMEHPRPEDYAAQGYPWWLRYQVVTYSLANSRSGSLADFQSMVNTCAGLGVDIYVDAVINHMTGEGTGVGSAGSSYGWYDYPAVPYTPSNFHGSGSPHSNCTITNYNDANNVRTCNLLSLTDLATETSAVRSKIADYLNSLIAMGVAGVRIDAAKHMHPADIAAIRAQLSDPSFYIFQEVIDLGGEAVSSSEYIANGDVTEFRYSGAMANAFTQAGGCSGPNLSWLNTLGTGLLASGDAVVFTNNHDNQRGHGAGGPCIVDYRDGDAVHDLASIFMLAYPYGYPSVMSSYHWDGVHDSYGPPSTSGPSGSGATTLAVYGAGQGAGDVPQNCDGTNWVCEHRRLAIANMVAFREATAVAPLTDWWSNPSNTRQIAFGRGDKGYVAINRDPSNSLTRTFSTSLAAGTYCDITQGNLTPDGTACTGLTIVVDSSGNIVNQTVNAMAAFAIHTAAKVAACSATPPTAGFALTTSVSGTDLTLSWTAFGGPYAVHVSTSDPYFTANGSTLLASPTGNSYTHTNALGIGSAHYYLVQVNNCAGSANSERIGEFRFMLVPGS